MFDVIMSVKKDEGKSEWFPFIVLLMVVLSFSAISVHYMDRAFDNRTTIGKSMTKQELLAWQNKKYQDRFVRYPLAKTIRKIHIGSPFNKNSHEAVNKRMQYNKKSDLEKS